MPRAGAAYNRLAAAQGTRGRGLAKLASARFSLDDDGRPAQRYRRSTETGERARRRIWSGQRGACPPADGDFPEDGAPPVAAAADPLAAAGGGHRRGGGVVLAAAWQTTEPGWARRLRRSGAGWYGDGSKRRYAGHFERARHRHPAGRGYGQDPNQRLPDVGRVPGRPARQKGRLSRPDRPAPVPGGA